MIANGQTRCEESVNIHISILFACFSMIFYKKIPFLPLSGLIIGGFRGGGSFRDFIVMTKHITNTGNFILKTIHDVSDGFPSFLVSFFTIYKDLGPFYPVWAHFRC